MKTKKIKVVVVDDHPIVTEGLRSSMIENNKIEVVACCESASELFSFLKRSIPDVIVLDVNLPDMNGVEICKKITVKYERLKIIGLSTYNDPSIIKQMINNGAKGYLLKNITPKELILAINQVSNGISYFSYEIQKILADSIFNTIETPKLTRREKEILKLVSEGITSPKIAELLFISPLTVDTHRRNLIQKMGVKNSAQLIKIAVEQNLI